MDDGNMLKRFHQILVHGFHEIGLHHLQPFLCFLNIHASIDQNVSMGKWIMMMETFSKSFSSIQSTIWEIWTKSRCPINLQNTEQHLQDSQWAVLKES